MNNENRVRKGITEMDILTIGFITVVILFMTCKFLFDLHMYRNSIYKVLYSGFTEYRMRKKSIEGMSQSYVLTEECGPNRMIYYVMEREHSVPSSFITIFLTSGCYLVSVKHNKNSDSFLEAKEFEQQNIMSQLENTVYNSLKFPTTIIKVLTDSCETNKKDAGKKNKLTIRREELLNTIKALHSRSEKVLTANDINGIFMTLAHDTIENEKIPMA